MMRVIVAAVLLASTMACGGGAPKPAAIDTASDTCGMCRMAVSDARLAAQIVAPGEEPVFFDDLGCLSAFLRDHPRRPGDAVYVADHHTGEWIPASQAVFSRLERPSTPMASGWIAHGSAASRDADRDAAGSTPVAAALVLGSAGAEEVRR